MPRHIWPEDIGSAMRIQDGLSKKVRTGPLMKSPCYVAGVDAAFDRELVVAVASLYEYPSLIHKTDAVYCSEVRFPYVPGYLSFREGRAIIGAVERLRPRPDLLIVDGQGIAHPRGLGLASHIGVLLDIPAIGCAKTRLVGEYEEPGPLKGDWSPLVYKGKTVGAVLRARDSVRPVFVSPGHLIDLESSIEVLLHCLTKYRLPEPVRRADHVSKECARKKAGDIAGPCR